MRYRPAQSGTRDVPLPGVLVDVSRDVRVGALAEADGNRTRPPGIARRTGFEDQEGHQSPFASHEKRRQPSRTTSENLSEGQTNPFGSGRS
jgi:hypothetical protein